MPWKRPRTWIVVALAIASGALAWLLASTTAEAPAPAASTDTSTTIDLAGRSIYTNGEYGFSFVYPETAQLEETFSADYRTGTEWRVNAVGTGTPIAAVIAYSTMSDHSYPRFFAAQVRIGASDDPDEIAGCLKSTPDRGEIALADVTMNGTTWKAFSFGDAGMMQYVHGLSYRTLHEGRCIALEKMQSGSSYREDPDSPEDLSDETLQDRYENLDTIIESFTFVRT